MEGDIDFPKPLADENLSRKLMKDWFIEFAPGVSEDIKPFVDIRELEVFDESEGVPEKMIGSAYRMILNPEIPLEQTVYTLDLDDTSVDYSGAKEIFHGYVLEQISNINPELVKEHDLELFLAQVNKSTRLLASNELNPEVYNPTLEVLTLAKVLGKMQRDELDFDWDRFDALVKEGDKKQINSLVREQIVAPIAEDLVNTKMENGKQYFVKIDGGMIFPTAVDELEVKVLNQLFADELQEDGEFFSQMYLELHEAMFEPEIHWDMLPKESDGGRYVLATFGEDRYQLVKVQRFLKRLRDAGERLPDEIIFFDAGRKAPVLKSYHDQLKNEWEEEIESGDAGGFKLVHVDNSENQCKALKGLGVDSLTCVTFMPGDESRPFEEIVGSS